MNQHDMRELLSQIQQNEITIDEAMMKLKTEPFTELGFAKIDNHRGVRQGAAEVIFGLGKTPEHILKIAETMRQNGEPTILITRMSEEAAEIAAEKLPLTYHKICKLGIVGEMPEPYGIGKIVVAAAGTSDLPVAEEAALTAEALGNEVTRLYDVGVAGVHRLLAHTEDIMRASVVIAVAGMEGALAGVVGGLADCPVIAVPTSVGYGASFGGLSALLSMLNTCASGVSVVNIDNGFGAGYQASMINHLGDKR